MKKIACLILSLALLLTAAIGYAAEYDLPNMTREELNALKTAVEKELSANHEASSSERTGIEKAFKNAVEGMYGTDNVEWPWFDYSYSKDWNYYEIYTSASITKSDGGKAKYNLVGGLTYIDNKYETIYLKVGNEVIWDNCDSVITDPRVRTLLGFDTAPVETVKSEEAASEPNVTAAPTPAPTNKPAATAKPEITYRKGDKGEEIKSFQLQLIALGYLNGTADGSFGKMTEDAVLLFQQTAGLPVTGIVNNETLRALYAGDAPKAPAPAKVYTASEIYKKFDDNKIAANSEFKEKVIDVSGRIYEIDEDIWGNPVVRLYADSWGFETVDCEFSTKNANSLISLKKDQSVTIRGTCDGFGFMAVELSDCQVIG